MKRIYLDYAASTPIDKKIIKEIKKNFSNFGNAGSIHYFGQKSISLLDKSREKISQFFDCQRNEIVFTSSATESNNLALRGVIKYFQQNILKEKNIPEKKQKFHVISSKIEHKSVLETLKDLEKQNIEISYISPNKYGRIEEKNIFEKVKENTILISIMAANNETGVIQPIKEISEYLKDKKNIFGLKPILHSDATQYIRYLKQGYSQLGAELISFSGHKIYTLKGIGGLFIKKNTKISPVITGGIQEYGFRAGTENILGAISLAKAIELIKENQEKEILKTENLKKIFLSQLRLIQKNIILNSGSEKTIPHILNIRFPNQKSDELLVLLDLKGIAVSSGSACTSRAIQPSHVLLSMGLTDKQARESIRFSFGRFTTEKEIKKTIKILKEILKKNV
jgi:cysteine desulfurase